MEKRTAEIENGARLRYSAIAWQLPINRSATKEAGISQMIALYKVEANFVFALCPLIYEKRRLIWKHQALLTLFTSINQTVHSTYIYKSRNDRLFVSYPISFSALSHQG